MTSFFSVGISLYFMWLHFESPARHKLLRFIIRILAMVPIYAIEAFIGLVAYKQNFYITTVRQMYEAWAIYSFWGLFNELVVLSRKPLDMPAKHLWPCNHFLAPWNTSERLFEHRVQGGVIQYVIVEMLTSLISLFCNIGGVYGDGEFSAKVAYPYIAFVVNCSQMYALYALVMYYLAVRKPLAEFNPGFKFICIKGIVFVSFWQGIVIAGFVYIGTVCNFLFLFCSPFRLLTTAPNRSMRMGRIRWRVWRRGSRTLRYAWRCLWLRLRTCGRFPSPSSPTRSAAQRPRRR